MNSPTCSFQVAAGVRGVLLGADPRIVLRADKTHTTSDPQEIARLSNHPHIKAVTKAPKAKARAAKPAGRRAAKPAATQPEQEV